MPGEVRCRWIEATREAHQLLDVATGRRPEPGAMFWAPWELEGDGPYGPAVRLSPRYWKLPAPRRAPIALIMPNREYFCVDVRFYEHPRGYHGDGWTVNGWVPNLTLRPSIDLVDRWHGHLTGGVLREVA